MSKKYIGFICLFFLLSSCTNEYWQYHEKKQILMEEKGVHLGSLENFSVEKIEDRDVEIFTTPDKKILDRLVMYIEKSQKQIFLEVYILTEKRIIKALKDAKKRGVDVHIVLEKNVFGATNINKNSFNTLKDSGIQITYDNSQLYNFVHTKLLIIDDIYIISTGNFSYSSFTTNREFYVIGKNQKDREVLEKIFLADFEGREIFESTPNLIISPINSRKKIETLLSSAEKNIFLYAQNFGDENILNILAEKTMQKIPVIICMADPSKIPSNTQAIALLREKGIQVRTSKKPTIHAKSILVDNTYNYIGSVNFSTNSLDNNREIGILTKSTPDFIQTFHSIFESDCPKSEK